MNTLYLGSKSVSRKALLEQALIPFEIVMQDADEAVCDWTLPLEQAVASIARYKMEHVIVPHVENQEIFVLTADTLSVDADGNLNGKPLDKVDAIKKIVTNRGMDHRLATAFCLDRKKKVDNQWIVQQRIEQVVSATYRFDIPDAWIERYLEHSHGMISSGAVAVELYGTQFLQYVHGSYSTVLGLPMYELRQSLEEIGFYK